jgi:hypothetical protein
MGRRRPAQQWDAVSRRLRLQSLPTGGPQPHPGFIEVFGEVTSRRREGAMEGEGWRLT